MAVGLEVVFTVALADRSALVRNMVEAVCQRYGLEVVGEASTGWQLVAVCQTRRPDLVVADSDLGDGPIETYLDRVLGTGAKVIILCDDASPERLTGLLERGVSRRTQGTHAAQRSAPCPAAQDTPNDSSRPFLLGKRRIGASREVCGCQSWHAHPH